MSLHLKFDKYLIVVDILSRTLVQAAKRLHLFYMQCQYNPFHKGCTAVSHSEGGGLCQGSLSVSLCM